MESKSAVVKRFLPIVIVLALDFLLIFFLIFMDYSFIVEGYKKELPKLYEECITKNLTVIYYGDFGYECNSIKKDYLEFYGNKSGG